MGRPTGRKGPKAQAAVAPARPPEATGKALVVLGEGWAALGLLGFLCTNPDLEGRSLIWISGSGSRMIPALPSLEAGDGALGPDLWARLARALGIDAGEPRSGTYLREFRNKSFRSPSWERAHTPEERKGVRDEALWAPERAITPIYETRFAMSIAELESRVREKILARVAFAPEGRGYYEGRGAVEAGAIRRIEGIPVVSIESQGGLLQACRLGSGERIECERFFYADRWGQISQLEGLPKGLPFVRGREPVGVLQAALTHDVPVAAGIQEGFFNTLHKEAGEEADRHLFGYFSSEGLRSFWTLCFLPEEAEDNHAIAKKLRRMKTALDRMFPTQPWLPEGKAEFMANVKGEQVRFEEGVVYSKGEVPRGRVALPGLGGLCFLTDGYGPGPALDQVGSTLRAEGLLREAVEEAVGLTTQATAPEASGRAEDEASEVDAS